MTHQDKVGAAKEFIARIVGHYRNPAMLCSFGKDSMVLLHLMRNMNVTLPLVYLRDPWFQRKHDFAQKIASDWDLVVHDYVPSASSMCEGNGELNFVAHYQIGAASMAVPKNILPPGRDERYLCGLRDVLQRPLGTFTMPWDVLFVGHKSSDVDPLAGSLELNVDVRSGAGVSPDMVFPLRHWTDEDVWTYTREHAVPQQETRYKPDGGEWDNKYRNSDYVRACTACIDKRNGATVFCPKLQLDVSNVSSAVPYVDVKCRYFAK